MLLNTVNKKRKRMSAARLIQQYVDPDFLTSEEWEQLEEELKDLSRQLGKMTLIDFLDYLIENRLVIDDTETKVIEDASFTDVKQAIVEFVLQGKAPYEIVSDTIRTHYNISNDQFEELVNQLVEDNVLWVKNSEIRCI